MKVVFNDDLSRNTGNLMLYYWSTKRRNA
jgi:hypothetical protein